jgi:hypothetical protein
MSEIQAFYASLPVSTWDWELILRCLLQVFLLASSAIFSGSETALFSLSRIDLQKLRQTRDKHSESIHALLDEPRRLIISILCGNELDQYRHYGAAAFADRRSHTKDHRGKYSDQVFHSLIRAYPTPLDSVYYAIAGSCQTGGGPDFNLHRWGEY